MKSVLVTPLDWGLGHATRCIPLIKELLNRKCNVVIAGSGDSLLLLKLEFPQLTALMLPAYQPVYPLGGSMIFKMLAQLPKFLSTIRKEHAAIEQIVKSAKIDLVISDNRYGCWSSAVPSVFITHQTNILLPRKFKSFNEPLRRFNFSLIKKFSFCWIPDYPDGRSLAGKLKSLEKKGHLIKVKYIGPLTRFTSPSSSETLYDVLCILSGPEPQRTELEKIVAPQLKSSELRYFIARGLVSKRGDEKNSSGADFLNATELQNMIEQSEIILSRSGYSTIMDLASLGKKAIFIPTPGQTEQEYLAARLKAKGIAFSVAQRDFNLMEALSKSHSYTGFNQFPADGRLLSEALDDVLQETVSGNLQHQESP
jgi:UDP:flavonoid glycosyltransferase YjiC (YdhE family)